MNTTTIKNGISLSELCLTMGLLGLLSITMLSLNNFSNVKAMTMQTQSSITESALMTWGKNATNPADGAIWNEINSSETLVQNLQKSLNAKDNKIIDVAQKYQNQTKAFKLSNGMVILAQYRNNPNKYTELSVYGLALIGIATDEQSIKKPIAVYQLTKDGLISIHSDKFDIFYADKATRMLTEATVF